MKIPAKASEYIKRDDIRGIYPDVLNGEVAEAVGYETCKLISRKTGMKNPRIAVGYDCRSGNLEIANSFSLGFTRAGGEVLNLGLCSTEYVYYFCAPENGEDCAGAMVTASHNPKYFNGLKLIHSGCIPFVPDELQSIGAAVDEKLEAPNPNRRFSKYAERMVELAGMKDIRHKTGFRVVVHAGHGMGAVSFSPIAELLKKDNLETIIVDGEPDGAFPQGVPNPLLPDFMGRLAEKVREYSADLGIGFDGDADRAGFTDSTGREIIPSQVLTLIGSAKTGEGNPDHLVVMRNICCSQLILHQLGKNGDVADTPVGHGRIKQFMRCPAMRDKVVFAGEHSGHYFYPEFNYLDSGVLTSLNMIKLLWDMKDKNEDITARLDEWSKLYTWSGEINFEMADRNQLMAAMKNTWQLKNPEGTVRHEVRMDEALGVQRVFTSVEEYKPEELGAPDLKMVCDNGSEGWWFVLRPSGNEPKLRLNVEAWGHNSAERCRKLTDELTDFLIAEGAVKK